MLVDVDKTMRYRPVINRVSEEHLKMTSWGPKHVVLILNQSIQTFVALTAEHAKGLNILLVVIHATGCK
jgi:hypothetical protein